MSESIQRTVITLLVGVVLFLGFSYFNLSQENKDLTENVNLVNTKYYESDIDKSTYQAIFITNGQVYFGKISGIDDNFVKLNDVFYLQDTSSKELVKLGNEMHAPKDPMFVSQQNILFWENLDKKGDVYKNITKQSNSLMPQ